MVAHQAMLRVCARPLPELCNPEDLDGLNRCVENPDLCGGCSVANADVGLGNTWLMAIGLAYLGWRLRRQAGRR